MNILGVRIDNFTKKEILEKIENFLNEPKFHQIATVNPEFILEAQKNEKFREILGSCDLNVADGFGIKCAFWRYGKHLKVRMTGVRLMTEILKLADKNDIPVFLVARSDGLSTWQETKDAILKIYPRLDISGENIDIKNLVIASEAKQSRYLKHEVEFKNNTKFSALKAEIATVAMLPRNDRAIVFCAFGAPHQELFLNSLKNDRIRLAMGVGGSFDFLTKKVRRAPVFLRRAGLEWLWRFLLQPKRWKRIWRAVVVFPVKVIFGKTIQ